MLNKKENTELNNGANHNSLELNLVCDLPSSPMVRLVEYVPYKKIVDSLSY